MVDDRPGRFIPQPRGPRFHPRVLQMPCNVVPKQAYRDAVPPDATLYEDGLCGITPNQLYSLQSGLAILQTAQIAKAAYKPPNGSPSERMETMEGQAASRLGSPIRISGNEVGV